MDEVVVVGEASAMLWATEFMLLRELQSTLERNQTPIISKKVLKGVTQFAGVRIACQKSKCSTAEYVIGCRC